MKKVSIVVPVYNAEKYLKDCIESLIHQTLKEIEIVFINDGSTDGSLEILEKYQKAYPQKIVIYSKENGGQASARNLGIKMSTGEYIGFVDSDDDVDLTMFQKMYEAAQREKCDFVECDYKYLQVSESGECKEIPCYGHVRAYKSNKEMFIDPLVSPWNKIYKASLLKENNINFPEGVIYEDTSFFIKSIPYITKSYYLAEPLAFHYLRPNSTMNASSDRRVGNIFAVLDDIIQFYNKNQQKDIYQNELEYFCVKILLCSSLNRVARVRDAKMRREYVAMTWGMIDRQFHDFRKNVYLKHNALGWYMKIINSFSIYIVVGLLRIRSSKL